ncbi:MAG: B12-binding domain-containing radical SAM protein [Elusimicrobia bacterium]|nr:B12-binding domain-containing radical SAM protein [Elusimicrobiota bacterium]
MRDVLLVYLSQEDSDYVISGNVELGMKNVPKLGLMYLAAVLARKGVAARILDQTLEPFGLDDLAHRLRTEGCGLVGFYSATALKRKLLSWIKGLRERGVRTPIIVGGPGFFGYADYLGAGADLVVRGEGEAAVCEIVDHFDGRIGDKALIRGICYAVDGRVAATPDRRPIEDLDALPFPARDGSSRGDAYHDFHVIGMRTPYTTMIASRGCPFRCAYCSSHNVWENKVRLRSAANVLAEVSSCVERFGTRYIGFKDDIFGWDQGWLAEFCASAARLRGMPRWSAMAHPLSFRKDKRHALEAMAGAGCDMLIFGLQSAHPDILAAIRRGAEEPEELRETVTLAKGLGITTVVEFIFGLPGDSPETMAASLDYVLRLKPHYAQFNALSLLEGSELGLRCEGRPATRMSDDEVRGWCAHASRSFYGHPGVLAQDFLHALRKNPAWFLRVAGHGAYVLRYLGFDRLRAWGAGRRPSSPR